MTGISQAALSPLLPNFRSGITRSSARRNRPGDTAAQIALAHLHLKVLGFDLPEVGPIFEEYASQLGLDGRLTFAPGSFFENPLPKADVIVMSHILHDWDLATKMALIRKTYDALPSSGAYIVYDAIIDDARRKNAFGLMMSLNMLIETCGGFDYTLSDGSKTK